MDLPLRIPARLVQYSAFQSVFRTLPHYPALGRFPQRLPRSFGYFRPLACSLTLPGSHCLWHPFQAAFIAFQTFGPHTALGMCSRPFWASIERSALAFAFPAALGRSHQILIDAHCFRTFSHLFPLFTYTRPLFILSPACSLCPPTI